MPLDLSRERIGTDDGIDMRDTAYAFPKPERRQTAKNREQRHQRDKTAEVRTYVFARERNLCRCCRKRPATSMHEIRFRSLGGKVSKRNSIALCGDGVEGCHGHCQAHRISIHAASELGAEGPLTFVPNTDSARDWMQIGNQQVLYSPPMVEMESE